VRLIMAHLGNGASHCHRFWLLSPSAPRATIPTKPPTAWCS